MTSERAHFLESPEGFTYIPYMFQDTICKRVMTPWSPKLLSKWNNRVKLYVKRTKLLETDDADTEYIDIDVLMGEYVEEFRKAKENFEKDLYK